MIQNNPQRICQESKYDHVLLGWLGLITIMHLNHAEKLREKLKRQKWHRSTELLLDLVLNRDARSLCPTSPTCDHEFCDGELFFPGLVADWKNSMPVNSTPEMCMERGSECANLPKWRLNPPYGTLSIITTPHICWCFPIEHKQY